MASTTDHLSRRERQIMEAIHRLGEGTVNDVLGELPDPPSYSAVRTQLGILEAKGHLRHRQDGRRYVYLATESTDRAGQNALKSLLRNFFAGSPSAAVAALLDLEAEQLGEEELRELADLVEAAREGKEALNMYAIDDILTLPVVVISLRAGLLVILAALVSRRLSSAASRSLVWGLALLGLALLPLGALTPAIELEVLPAEPVAAIEGVAAPVAQTRSVEAVGVDTPSPTAGVGGTELAEPPTSPSPTEAATGASTDALRAPGSARPLAAGRVAMAVWLLGVMVVLARLAVSLRARRRLLHTSVRSSDPGVLRQTASLAARLGLRRWVDVRSSDRLEVPVTWGRRRPVLLLPSSFATWSSELRRSVLLHELAHVRRGDATSRLLSCLVCALHWPIHSSGGRRAA